MPPRKKFLASCFLCDKKQVKAEDGKLNIHLHRFPKNKETCLLWIQACGLEKTDHVSSLKICSEHFKLEDYNNPTLVRYRTLKHQAVPTIKVPVKVLMPGSTLTGVDLDTFNMGTLPLITKSLQVPLDTSTSTTSINCDRDLDIFDGQSLKVSLTARTSTTSKSKDLPHESTPHERKRLFFKPQHANEICTPHFTTPIRARRTISFVKTTLHTQTRKINKLREKNRSLVKKISHLKQLLLHLQEKNI